jgi:hypothetical protein
MLEQLCTRMVRYNETLIFLLFQIKSLSYRCFQSCNLFIAQWSEFAFFAAAFDKTSAILPTIPE